MNSKLNLESVYGVGSNFFFSIRWKKVSKSRSLTTDLTNKNPLGEINQIHLKKDILI
jgi:hypothetical protein